MMKPSFPVLLALVINNAGAAARKEKLPVGKNNVPDGRFVTTTLPAKIPPPTVPDENPKMVPNGKFFTTIPPPPKPVPTERPQLTTLPAKILPPTVPSQEPKTEVPDGKFVTTIPPPPQLDFTEGLPMTTIPAKEPPVGSKEPLLPGLPTTGPQLSLPSTKQSLSSSVISISTYTPSVYEKKRQDPMIPEGPVITTERDLVVSTISPGQGEVSGSNVIDIQSAISTNTIHYASVTVETSVPPETSEILQVLEPVTAEDSLDFVVPDSNFIFQTLLTTIQQKKETSQKLPVPKPSTIGTPLGFVPDNNFIFLTLPPIPLATARASTQPELFSPIQHVETDALIANDIPNVIQRYTTNPVVYIDYLNLEDIQTNRPSTPRGPLMEAFTAASTTRPPSIADSNQVLLRQASFDILASGNSTRTLSPSSTPIPTTNNVISSSTKSKENGIALNQMSSLLNQMLSGYNTVIRPRNDQTRFVLVYSEFVTLSIIEFDTQEQRFSVMGYFKMNWRDDFLTWDPNSYEGTETIRLSTKSIWIPKLTIDKAYNGKGSVGELNTDVALVHYKGYVQWFPEGTYSIVCQVNIEYYPFDDQICRLRYFIGSEDNTTINLRHMETVDTSEYIENAEWKLVNLTFEKKLENGIYYIDYVFKVKRRSGFAMFTLVVPVLLLSLLTGATFIIPVDSGEKLGFAVSTFLAYGIFDTIIIDTLPHNSLNVSYFILYIASLMLVSVFLTFYSIVQSKIFLELGTKEHDVKSQTGQRGGFTWLSFLKKMDVVAFSFFSVVIIGVTSTFLAALITKVDVF